MAPNGTLYISDLGNNGTVVWSNELLTNRTAATCSPYSLSVLTNGMLIERDCANRTVWVMPNLAGDIHTRTRFLWPLLCAIQCHDVNSTSLLPALTQSAALCQVPTAPALKIPSFSPRSQRAHQSFCLLAT
jgi:hypothetical protein